MKITAAKQECLKNGENLNRFLPETWQVKEWIRSDRWCKEEGRKSSFCFSDGHMSSEKCQIGDKEPRIRKVELYSEATLWKMILVSRKNHGYHIQTARWQKKAGKKHNIDPMWKVLNKEVDLGEPTSFLDHRKLEMHSTTMRNKQRYCGQLQNHVWIANFCANFSGGSREITISSKYSYFFMVVWYGRSCDALVQWTSAHRICESREDTRAENCRLWVGVLTPQLGYSIDLLRAADLPSYSNNCYSHFVCANHIPNVSLAEGVHIGTGAATSAVRVALSHRRVQLTFIAFKNFAHVVETSFFRLLLSARCIKEVELVDSVGDLRSSSSIRSIPMPDFEVLDARIASALNKIIHNSLFKRKISLEEQGPWKRTVSFEVDRLPTWSTNNSGSLEPIVLSRPTPTYSLSVHEMMIFRNSIRNVTKFFDQWRKSRLMTSWKDCTN